MGLKVDRERFEESDYEAFERRLERSLVALRRLLERTGFGVGSASLGAELEVFLVDAQGRPLPLNHAVLRRTVDPRLTVELDRFNLECNLRPAALAGRPFGALGSELDDALAEVRRAARTLGGEVAVIGILPTLQAADLSSHAMTDSARFRALSAGLERLRRGPAEVDIDGAEPLSMTCDAITFEGANTSLQVHLRVDPAEFAPLYNAVQQATAAALAVAGNSPTFLGHRLWEETRVALFKQVVDDRDERTGRPPRVGYGSGWVQEGAYELFAESVADHAPLLPVLADEDPLACVEAGGVPRLDEVRLHQGTVWRWNRAVYDPAEGGHLRIEMRGLPAGPTVVDMVANTAFLVGLALGLAADGERWTHGLPFAVAEHNFYRAAQRGLEAELGWPRAPGEAPVPFKARALVVRLLPLAQRGLDAAGVDPAESADLLGLIAERASVGQTGAVWQRETLDRLEPELGREPALAAMLQHYQRRSETGEPVHTWSVPA